ncbi:MAG: two-component system response regulator GlrR [Gammaproteobacteria bacterium]|jgi:two-component system response regulator GlrR
MPVNENKKSKILIVDDDQEILDLLSIWLNEADFEVITSSSGEQALEKLSNLNPSLVITDLIMTGMSGLDLLAAIHGEDPLLPVILLSGQAKIPDAVKATHLGSSAFLTKPIGKTELLSNVRRYLRLSSDPAAKDTFSKNIIFQSKVMAKLLELSHTVAESNVTVLITGATGTGKEIIARAIHDASPRQNHPFIAINCGAIPEQLLESELFGHEKGAFSGAISKHEGLFQAANGGTLFLDEIGDMPLTLQVKLLRVLQDFEVRPVGSTKSFPIDVRIISATHNDLEKKVENSEFREDLYYRLKVVPIVIPKLSQRREDIPLLAAHFLHLYATANKKEDKRFSPDAMQYLLSVEWPGNIRQLMNVVDLCATLCKTDIIPLSFIKKALQSKPGKIQTLKKARQEFEEKYLISILRITNGHVANAATIAGRNRTEFYKLLNQHNLEPSKFRKDAKSESFK